MRSRSRLSHPWPSAVQPRHQLDFLEVAAVARPVRLRVSFALLTLTWRGTHTPPGGGYDLTDCVCAVSRRRLLHDAQRLISLAKRDPADQHFALAPTPAASSLPIDTRALQHYLGHKNIQHTVRYTELSPARFRDFWKD